MKSERPHAEDRILDALCRKILEEAPHIDPERVTPDASLTDDLEIDSVHLMALFAFARAEIADVDFTPWYVEAIRSRRDTLRSLAEYLHRAAP